MANGKIGECYRCYLAGKDVKCAYCALSDKEKTKALCTKQYCLKARELAIDVQQRPEFMRGETQLIRKEHDINFEHSNFTMLFGCDPRNGVEADT